MQFTNKYNLPASLASALATDDYAQDGDISITGLINPPRIVQLKKRHDEEIIEDVSENIWRLLGKSIHYILHLIEEENVLKEERIAYPVKGWTVTGATDLYDSSTITDYKLTSVWAVMYGLKDEWITQTNSYAHLFRSVGFKVERLQIVAILRDWRIKETLKYKDYPCVQVKTFDVPLWEPLKTQIWMENRVLLHQKAVDLSDEHLPKCLPVETWEKPTIYAVKKQGNKTAISGGLHKTMEDAQCMIEERNLVNHIIEIRPGARPRCDNYCNVKQWCNQYLEYSTHKERA